MAEHLEATTPWPAVIKGATERWKAIGKCLCLGFFADFLGLLGAGKV